MAEKRMISKQIIDSDTFLDMPLSAQALYFHLLMRADDDGFVDNSKKIVRMICASEDDLKLLIAKRYLLVFETGVVVVKHWRVHNYIAKDRYNTTSHTSEYSMLDLLPNKEYSIKNDYAQDYPQTFPQVENGNNLESFTQDNAQSFQQTFPQNSKSCIQSVYTASTECIQDVDNPDTNCSHRLDKISIDKKRLDEVSPAVDKMSTDGTNETDKDDDETDDDKNADKEKVPPEPVDPETFKSWFKADSGMGSNSDVRASDKPRRNPTPAEDMADKVGQLFRQLLPLLPYAGVPDKLVVDIARAGKPLDYYQAVFERAAASSYLREPHGGKNWCCSIAWLIKPENAEKVLSGKYDDFAKSGKAQVQEPQGVTMVNGAENGFETSPMFEAALQRGMKKMAEVAQKPRGEAQGHERGGEG